VSFYLIIKSLDKETISLNKTKTPADPNLQKFLQGVIWDMDGVLLDSTELHFKIWKQIFSEFGVDYSRENFIRLFGMTNLETIQTVLGKKLSLKESLELAKKRQQLFMKQVTTKVRMIPGAVQWLQFFFDRNIPQVIASSNAQRFIEFIVKQLNINDFFQALVSAEDLASKPNPAVFLESARRLNAQPRHCLVFEDAVAGIEGAKKAGMKCIAITTTNSPDVLEKADLIIPSFSALTQAQILQLMAF
jgi:HAD superfamily hydrolase (TIGR01509 family)